jgi:ABC-type arginine transport system ATPase subunit
VQLELLDQKLSMDGTDYHLFPGLTVQADLITGRQRLLDILMQGQKSAAAAK